MLICARNESSFGQETTYATLSFERVLYAQGVISPQWCIIALRRSIG
jgi:hypothetical protein